MANVLRRPTRWTRQPPGRVPIDRSHPSSAGMISALSGTSLVDCWDATKWTTTGIVTQNTGVFNGAGARNLQTVQASSSKLSRNLGAIALGSPFTALMGIRQPANDGSTTLGGLNDTFALYLQASGVSNFIYTVDFFWGNQSGNHPGGWTADPMSVGVTFASDSPYTQRAFINGKQIDTRNAQIAATNGNWDFGYGFHGYGANEVYYAYFWRRTLTPDEIASLSANPWQLFEPIRRAVFFAGGLPTATGTAAAVGGATTKAAGVGNTVGSGKAVGGATTKATGSGVTVGTAAARGGGAAKATGSGSSIGTGTAAAVAGGSAKAAGASAKLGAGKAVAGGAAKAAGAATHSGTAAAVGGAAAKAVGAPPLPPSTVDHYIQGWPVNAAGAVIVHVVP